MFNEVIILGRLTKDIELKYTQNGLAVAKSSIASSHKYKDKTTGEQKEEVMFIDINIFGRSAEIANQYLKKGDLLQIVGRLTLNQWVGSDGQKRSKHEIIVERLILLPKSNSNSLQQNTTYQKPENQTPTPPNIEDEEIPF
jgi:single-strand DNA-binding protein